MMTTDRQVQPRATTAPSVTDLRAVTTVTITTAGAFLGMSQAAAYRAARTGELPTIKVGGYRKVATPVLLGLIGLPYEVHDGEHKSA